MSTRDGVSVASSATRGFIDEQGATFHDLFGVQARFNPAMAQYQPSEVVDLEDTLKQFHDQPELDFDVLKCTWDDVLREMDRAIKAGQDSKAPPKKLHQKLWRKLGAMGGTVAPALVAIPDELCVLHGGLALIFSLARQRMQSRQKILQAFEDIPDVMMMASGKFDTLPQNHPRRRKLHENIKELQQVLLRTLPALIDRLSCSGTMRNKTNNFFKGWDVDDLLLMVHNSAQKVRTCAEVMMDEIRVVTHQTVHNNYVATRNLQSTAEQTEEGVGQLHRKIEQLLNKQNDIQITLESISGKNNLLNFLIEFMKTGQHEASGSPARSESVQESVSSAPAITPVDLINLMDVQHLAALDAEHHVIQTGHSIDRETIAHAASMFRTDQIQRLLHSPESDVVLVNGHGDRTQQRKISPISYVCATLVQALRRLPRTIVLVFYCGQHSTNKDDLIGPQGVMRSLVAFLVLSLVQNQHISDRGPIAFPALEGGMEGASFAQVCQLFYRLVELTPEGVTVHCILDGISFCERDECREDYDMMMRCFSGIIDSESMGATFKLLLTSATTSRWMTSQLEPHQKVSLRNSRRKGSIDPDTYLSLPSRDVGGSPAE
ncbi:hypothetical protein BT63DRAFT_422585 [Microthyrium microscopicum]|uniref:Uncharacterized protein n=1 Tax=Microthyrium microscopicum TaxID=703497 RepID=A0A6A6UJY9_9PEZI|nr:hypothetical protein BT63DRAFT_422585 [Microthyrium microscopicum]